MSKSIWKFGALVCDTFTHGMPKDAAIVHVHSQGNLVCLWAMVDPAAPLETRNFALYGTGHPFLTIPASTSARRIPMKVGLSGMYSRS